MSRGGPRKGFGGAQPGAGRKPLDDPTKRHVIRLTESQSRMFKELGGSPWLQGYLNLKLREKEANSR